MCVYAQKLDNSVAAFKHIASPSLHCVCSKAMGFIIIMMHDMLQLLVKDFNSTVWTSMNVHVDVLCILCYLDRTCKIRFVISHLVVYSLNTRRTKVTSFS